MLHILIGSGIGEHNPKYTDKAKLDILASVCMCYYDKVIY